MYIIVAGERLRPRVAYVGSQPTEAFEGLRDLFPTRWQADRFDLLPEQVDYRELDLIIIGPDAAISPPGRSGSAYDRVYRQYTDSAPVISFSSSGLYLPGPLPDTWLRATDKCTTEEYALPQGVPLELDRQRSAELPRMESVRGWFEYSVLDAQGAPHDEADLRLERDALFLNPHTRKVFAASYMREVGNLGVAVFPHTFELLEWVRLLVLHWAREDQGRFPGFADWRRQTAWMVPEEAEIAKAIADLEQEKLATVTELDRRILELNRKLTDATLAANQGRRRLLTHQGSELVDEVTSVFSELGFLVDNVDAILPTGEPKREDLRLKISGDDRWQALVEVRGYTASAGKTSDLGRLYRFASKFMQEAGRPPDQLIYVVNGQIDIFNPSRREEPLAASPEDVEVFAENSGLIISTLDLFMLAKTLRHRNVAEVREAIRQARGRWKST